MEKGRQSRKEHVVSLGVLVKYQNRVNARRNVYGTRYDIWNLPLTWSCMHGGPIDSVVLGNCAILSESII